MAPRRLARVRLVLGSVALARSPADATVEHDALSVVELPQLSRDQFTLDRVAGFEVQWFRYESSRRGHVECPCACGEEALMRRPPRLLV